MGSTSRTLRISKDELISSIKQIIDDKETLNKRQIEKKWEKFMNTYPIIFFQLIDSDCSKLDMNTVEAMIDDVNNIDDGVKTNEEVELDLGNTLAEEFVYPKVERPSPTDMIKAYKKMMDKKYNSSSD